MGKQTKIIDSRADQCFIVQNIITYELRIKLVDCRSNEIIKKARVNKICVKVGDITFWNEFDRLKDNPLNIPENEKLMTEEQITTASIDALVKLGYGTKPIVKEKEVSVKAYDATWKAHLNNYWNDRFFDFVDLKDDDIPSREMRLYVIKEYQSHRATNEDGILCIQIPISYKPNSLSSYQPPKVQIQVGFFNFPVALEDLTETGKEVFRSNENAPVNTGTGFDIKWSGRQSLEWAANFGWKICQGKKEALLKTAAIIKFTMFNFFELQLLKYETSQYYKKDDKKSGHVVLLAMQWCQPVWDGIDDADPSRGKRSNDFAFVNMKEKYTEKWIRNLNMHIPASSGASGAYYGRCVLETPYPRGQRAHRGIDLYSGTEGNNPIFAIHAGELKMASTSTDYGYQAALFLKDEKHPSFMYGHLNEKVTAKSWVMAGEKIGVGGITKQVVGDNITSYHNDVPYHVHLEFFKVAPQSSGMPTLSSTRNYIREFIGMSVPQGAEYTIPTKDNVNSFMFLAMNELPLVYPCKSVHRDGQSGKKYNYACKMIGSQSKDVCFALSSYPYKEGILLQRTTRFKSTELYNSAGLHRYICPWLSSTMTNKKIQLQAKVKFIHVNHDRFSPSPFLLNNGGSTNVLNKYFSSEIVINGNTDTSIDSITKLVKAHYYCVNGEVLKDNKKSVVNPSIDKVRIKAFINKYVSTTEIPADSDYDVIRSFYAWFSTFDFSKMTHKS